MRERRTLPGNGIVPNLIRLIVFGLALALAFGPIRAAHGTPFEWLSYLIAGLLLLLFICLLFRNRSLSGIVCLLYLGAIGAVGVLTGDSPKIVEARQHYALVAGRSPAYAVLFPEEIKAWIGTFEAGSVGANSIQTPDIVGDRRRFLSNVQHETETMYFLATTDLDMTDKGFVSAYQTLASQHGDWLGYMARCVHAGGETAPLLKQYQSVLEQADKVGRSIRHRY